MNAPWNNEDLRRAFDADFDALVAFASRSKAWVGYAFLRADGQVDLGRPLVVGWWVGCGGGCGTCSHSRKCAESRARPTLCPTASPP